jgi:hypothetical protein
MRRVRWLGKPLKWFYISEGRSELCGILAARNVKHKYSVAIYTRWVIYACCCLHIVPTLCDGTALPLKATRHESLLQCVHHATAAPLRPRCYACYGLYALAPGPSLHANDGLVLVLFSGFPNLPSSRPPNPFPLPICGGGPYPPLPPPLIPNPPRSGPGPGFEGPVGAPGILCPCPLAPAAFAPLRGGTPGRPGCIPPPRGPRPWGGTGGGAPPGPPGPRARPDRGIGPPSPATVKSNLTSPSSPFLICRMSFCLPFDQANSSLSTNSMTRSSSTNSTWSLSPVSSGHCDPSIRSAAAIASCSDG